jgi:methionine synthase II (cobalamin-independent)
MEIKYQRLNLISLITVFIVSIAAFWLGVSNASSKKLGIVDMQVLIQVQSQQLSKAYPNGQVPPKIMQQVVEEIKTVIKDFGQDKKITLLAKGAVLSGEYPDYTQEILSLGFIDADPMIKVRIKTKAQNLGGVNEQSID